MKHLINFITTSDISKSTIYSDLKCSKEEAIILQYIIQRFIKGLEESAVIDIIQESFDSKEYQYLDHLVLVKNLIDLGWLVQMSFGQVKTQEVIKLEILNSLVAPSISLLRLLEDGSLEISMPETKPYTDHLEYLQEQFDTIELLHKISISKRGFITDTSLSIGRLQNRLSLLNNRITARLEMTDEPIVVEEFFSEKKFDEREQKIFLALLREEYSGGEGQLREMNTLIELISVDEYDKIRNRSLLEDGSKLLSDNILDYEEILNMFGGISRSFYLQEEILQKIIHPNKKKKVTKLRLDKLVEEQEIFEYLTPSTSLDDVVLHSSTKKLLDTIVRQVDKDVFAKLKAWGIKDKRKGIDARIIFYGSPGTGKTMTAVSLAKSLKRPILSFDCSKILSMYVGESEKNVRKVFDDFRSLSKKAKVDPILLLNEADQFLSARSEGTGSSADKMHNQMQNIFLEQIEKFEGILIATTNLLDNIDKAFSRRFNYKVEFKKPDRDQRERLWHFMLLEKASYEESFDVAQLSKHELTGGQIDLIIRNTAYKVAVREESVFSIGDFEEEISKELGSSFESEGKSMGFKI